MEHKASGQYKFTTAAYNKRVKISLEMLQKSMAHSVENIIKTFSNDRLLKEREKIGLCRLWTDRVLHLANETLIDGQPILVEAREVKIEENLFHTFILFRYNDETYIWDGIGVGECDPYFGPEHDAPEHLKGSTLDIISRIRNAR